MGRPIIATILSLGLELPLSIGGVAIYILVMHGTLLGVYWWQAISGGLEFLIVIFILLASNWDFWADEARKRQEAGRGSSEDVERSTETEDGNSDHVESSSRIAVETDEENGEA